MNHRVLELLKTPKNIQSEDLHLLKEEINSFPYVQNIRALYLYGVHLYDRENYQGALSTTAAYTTDKKILYQLINGKIQQLPKPEIKAEAAQEKPIPAENPLKLLYKSKMTGFPIKREESPAFGLPSGTVQDHEQTVPDNPVDEEGRILPPPREEIQHLYVEGERNRILYEGEENFLEDDTADAIDLEDTLESGSIVIQKNEKKEDRSVTSEEKRPVENVLSETVEAPAFEEHEAPSSEADFHEVKVILETIQESSEETESPEAVENKSENAEEIQQDTTAEFTPETVIEEENIHTDAEKAEILDESEVSFHETAAFMPDVSISTEDVEKEVSEPVAADTEDPNSIREPIAEFTPEKIIHEDKISSEKVENTVQDESELSFHGMDSFLPEVKIQASEQETTDRVPQPNLSKHEDEMRRLIEEVEKKMKEKAASEEHQKSEEPEYAGNDISFAETQHFEVKPEEPEVSVTAENKTITENSSENSELRKEEEEQKEEPEEEKPSEVNPSWRPMAIASNLPDSLLNKTGETSPSATEKPVVEADHQEVPNREAAGQQKQEAVEKPEEANSGSGEPAIVPQEPPINEDSENSDQRKQEAPVMNVSFFGSGWTIPKPEKKENKEEPIQETAGEKEAENKVGKSSETSKTNAFDSNVPGFINTWQSWLKIDRTEEVEKDKVELKNKVIETFIENNPKISQLKEESSFVIREKGDDISHLMTETLANLYFEQKLYTKAIKAFEILIRKTPEKKKYYEGKIQEIKDFRTKGN